MTPPLPTARREARDGDDTNLTGATMDAIETTATEQLADDGAVAVREVSEPHNPLARLERDALAVADEATPEGLAELLCFLDAVKARVREAEARIKVAAIAWIDANKRNIELGDGSYWYAAFTKETKCADVPKTLETLFIHKGGDFAAVAGFLASGPFKYGAVREQIGDDDFAKLFTVETRAGLKRGGAPVEKQLMKADHRFKR